ncbi:MAG: hypothetical protein M3530_04805 [Thermoproteota archaeon]|nr:hypothetical protein [Thermoproteota archaeon]
MKKAIRTGLPSTILGEKIIPFDLRFDISSVRLSTVNPIDRLSDLPGWGPCSISRCNPIVKPGAMISAHSFSYLLSNFRPRVYV